MDEDDKYYIADQDADPDRVAVNRPFPFDAPFDARALPTKYCMDHYLFTCSQLQEILEVLGVGPTFTSDEGDHADSLTVLCMAIRRLGYPTRLNRMEAEFGRSPSAISRLVNGFIKNIMSVWNHVLTWDTRRLTPAKLGEYAVLSYERSGRECNALIGVIDGTVRKIQAPTKGQRAASNGHKRFHTLKYQTVVAPDGIIIHISKAYVGSQHNDTIYEESGIIDILEEHAYDTEDNPLALHGSPAYQPDAHMIIGYTDHPTPDQERFNQGCNSMRIIVEWAFDKVTNFCSGTNYPRSRRMLPACIESHYRFCVLLSNIHTCFYGDQGNLPFSIDPPTLREYLQPGAIN